MFNNLSAADTKQHGESLSRMDFQLNLITSQRILLHLWHDGCDGFLLVLAVDDGLVTYTYFPSFINIQLQFRRDFLVVLRFFGMLYGSLISSVASKYHCQYHRITN